MVQSIAGTNLATNWHASYATPVVDVYADWNMDGDYGDAYENISAYVRAVRIEHRLYDQLLGMPMLGQTQPSTATIVIENAKVGAVEHFFSPDTAGGLGATYTPVANGFYRVPVKVEMGYNDPVNGDEVLRQFTGVIEGYTDLERVGVRQVTFTCRGLDRLISQYKLTSAPQSGKRIDEILDGHLTTAGVASTSLDQSLTLLDWEWADDVNLLEHVRELAAADGGWLYFDKTGTALFERATHWLEGTEHTASQATLDEAGTVAFVDKLVWRNLYNSVVVEYSPVGPAPACQLYKAARTFIVPPSGAITEICRFTRVAEQAIDPVAGIDYDACSAGGKDLRSDLTVAMTAYAEQASVTLTNANANHAIYVYGLQIRGYPLVIDESQEVRSTSELSLIDGTKEYALRGNRWIQSRSQAQRLAGRLLELLQYPRRLWVWDGPLCPFLELGDRVTVVNTAKGLNDPGYIVGLVIDWQIGGLLTMSAEILPAANVFAANYFLLGTSEYSATSDPVYC